MIGAKSLLMNLLRRSPARVDWLPPDDTFLIHELETKRGLPAAEVHHVIAYSQPHIEQLQVALDLSPDCYESIVLPVITRFIAKAHLLPASEGHHHSESGGLLRHSLEVATLARRYSDNSLYGLDSPPELRGETEAAWRLAIALAGLLHDCGKLLTDYRVVDPSEKLIWNPCLEDLPGWTKRLNIQRYFIRWNQYRFGKHEIMGGLLVSEILGEYCIRFLTRHGEGPFIALYQTVVGMNADAHFGKLILDADQSSVASDLKGHPMSPGSSAGSRRDELVLEAIKALILGKVWSFDGESPQLQLCGELLLIDWFQVQPSLLRTLRAMSPIGWREDPDQLADLLLERGHAVEPPPTAQGSQRYWLEGKGAKSLRMLKLINTEQVGLTVLLTSEAMNSDEAVFFTGASLPETPERVIPDPSANMGHQVPPPRSLPAEIWIDQKTQSTEILAMLDRLYSNAGATGLRKRDDHLWIPYPEAFKVLEISPIQSLKVFQEAGMLELDAKTGMRAVLEIDGERGCTFTREATLHIESLWKLPALPDSLIGLTTEAHESSEEDAKDKSQRIDTRSLFTPERLRAVALVPHEK